MQLRLPWRAAARAAPAARVREVVAGGRVFPIDVTRHRWARRYLMRVTADGRVRLTVPRWASIAAGLTFVETERAWIAREWLRIAERHDWRAGTTVWWRGERVVISEDGDAWRCGPVVVRRPRGGDIRAALQREWRRQAAAELPDRCRILAHRTGLLPARATVRDQKSRWGACSARRTITLNWRLMQMPSAVADYVILHELAHLEHPNHSRRFWRKVAAICPSWRDSERWLRRYGRELL